MQKHLWPSRKVRETFLEFFCQKNKHKHIRSSSVLPRKHSGTYFTNAGMNQFKSVILGEMEARDLIDMNVYMGVANSQKCIRIGGKHNDLEDIGKDTYHHTFFEMLGNWSFGSYGNERACEMALDLLVNVYKLDPNRLYFTYFAGDSRLGIKEDAFTKGIWLKLGIPEKHVLPFGIKDNFWEMDVVGPCGPCTEIHYDRLPSSSSTAAARDLVNAGTERVIELWNLVFMNFNRTGPSSFSPLPSQVVDTGMGLERLCAVLNNLESNYDTDLFVPIFHRIHEIAQGRIPVYNGFNSPIGYSYRVLSDHMRSICVSISDGLLPSRNGLGGFLKYLILKCLSIVKTDIGSRDEDTAELLCQLVPVVIGTLESAYPSLSTKTPYIQAVIKHTHSMQAQKLNASTQIIDRYLTKLKNPAKLSAQQIWKLFKGDGSGEEIPIDFIRTYCGLQKSIQLDLDGFDKLLLEENEKALRNMKNIRTDHTAFIDFANMIKSVVKTDDSFKYKFDMNDPNKDNIIEAKITAIGVKDKKSGKYKLVSELGREESDCVVVTDRTNFYPESGGQAADQGFIINQSNQRFRVDHVLHLKGFTFHVGRVVNDSEKTIKVNDVIQCSIDSKRRYETALNHTGVHLLNHAIRKHFSSEESIIQTNSIVTNDHLKFEFKFNERLYKPSVEDLRRIEEICQQLVRAQIPVYTRDDVRIDDSGEVPLNYPLRRLNDVLYPTSLRVVSLGAEWDQFLRKDLKEENVYYSAELCCGTHASNTNQLEDFVLRSFNTLGDSSFEIDALTSTKAQEAMKNDRQVLEHLKKMQDLQLKLKQPQQQLSSKDVYSYLHSIADQSAKMESILQSQRVSYLNVQYVQKEAVNCRPSKNMLQNALRKLLEDELNEKHEHQLFDTELSRLNARLIRIESTLSPDLIVSCLDKLKTTYDVFVVFNAYRNVYILYSRSKLNDNSPIKTSFDSFQNRLSEQYKVTSLESVRNSRVLRISQLTS